MADELKLSPTQVKDFLEGPVWAVLKEKFKAEYDSADSYIDTEVTEFGRGTAVGARRVSKWSMNDLPKILESESKDESPLKKLVKYGKSKLEG